LDYGDQNRTPLSEVISNCVKILCVDVGASMSKWIVQGKLLFLVGISFDST